MLSTLRTTGRAAGLGLAALLIAACASGPGLKSTRSVDLFIAGQDWQGAETYLEKHKESEYGQKNLVLYYLDLGTILQGAGQYQASDEAFDKAEKRMVELYTKSLHQAAGLLLLNDSTMDYAGEPYERALTNVFRALNYVFMGKPDEALVESRKVEDFLQQLNEQTGAKDVYKDDAFARYLDSLLYSDRGQSDDARVSMDWADKAYAQYAADYHIAVPQFSNALSPGEPGDFGELVFIHYNGTAPRKISKTIQVAWGNALAITKQNNTDRSDARVQNALNAGVAGHAITVAYPEYHQDFYRIARSQVFVDGAPQGEPTKLMEPISQIAFKTLKDQFGLIEARAVARATVKYILAQTTSQEAGKLIDRQFGTDNAVSNVLNFAARGLAFGTAAATESADTRDWATLPSQIRMARMKVPSGRHDVEVRFLDAAGNVVTTADFKDVQIEKSKRTYLSYRTAS